jgi:hypothetical protein
MSSDKKRNEPLGVPVAKRKPLFIACSFVTRVPRVQKLFDLELYQDAISFLIENILSVSIEPPRGKNRTEGEHDRWTCIKEHVQLHDMY